MLTSSIVRTAPAARSQLLRFGKAEAVFFQGDPIADYFHTVVEGVVRTCRYQADGQRQVTGFHYPGDVFGIFSEQYGESAEAVTEVSCRCVLKSSGGIHDRSPAHDDVDSEQMLRQALDSANSSIFLLGRRTAFERLAAFILATGERLGNLKQFDFPMCRTDMADYLGLSIHTVSRTMTQLCDQGLIALDGPSRCRIVDLAGLRALAGHD